MNRNTGLRPGKSDRRDLSHYKKFGAVSLASLPVDGLHRPEPPLRDQDGTFECTGYTATAMRQAKFGIAFSPDWFVAQEAKIDGFNGIFTGSSLRTQGKVIKNVGCLPQSLAPHSWQKDGANYVANPKVWDEKLIGEAKKYRANGFLSTDGPYDPYDNIRVSLFMHDTDKEGVTAGVKWSPEWNNVEHNGIVNMPSSSDFFPHNVRFYDWTEQGLVTEAHIGKVIVLPREVVNKYVYRNEGPYVFVDDIDIEATKAEQWGLLEKIKNWLIQIQAWLFVRQLNVPVPQIVIPDQHLPEKAPEVETPQQMVLRVCKEENMGEILTDQIYRTVQCESNFYSHAKRENKGENGKVLSTDWGICQYNDYYYIGPEKPIPSIDVALNDPEFCVRVMCRMFKQGRARDWICWRRIFNQP